MWQTYIQTLHHNIFKLLRCSHTRALFRPQKLPKRARSGVLKGTKNWLPRSNQSVFGVPRIQLARISWKIEAKLTGLVTQRLNFKKNDAKQPKFPPCRNWPLWCSKRQHSDSALMNERFRWKDRWCSAEARHHSQDSLDHGQRLLQSDSVFVNSRCMEKFSAALKTKIMSTFGDSMIFFYKTQNMFYDFKTLVKILLWVSHRCSGFNDLSKRKQI